ncbi:MAG: magnesium transporter [Actinobacteria bacterium]|nr:magnesium transporter [Actinomycetota bacterium]
MTDETSPSKDLLGVAVEHATDRIPHAEKTATAGDVLATLIGARFEYANEIAVLDDSKLVGLLPIEQLLDALEDARIDGLMDADPPVVAPGDDQERVAWKMARHGESGIAVVDDQGALVGLIPPNRMLAVLLEEHDTNIARIAGYLSGTRRARDAAEEDVAHRLWHRLPWLLIGLAGAMGSAGLMGAFDRQLEDKVLIAFFVPAVAYLADAVGAHDL